MPTVRMSPEKKIAAPHSPQPLPRRRRFLFALLAIFIVPFLALALLELILRLSGFGYPTSFLLKEKQGAVTYLVDNDKFGWRFFPKQLARSPATLKFPAQKAAGTIRVFVFGESAALGDPKPGYSIGRYLEVLLRERFPSAKFEVITAAMTAVNSHALLPIARECARLDGDFWVVYMGNNEMAGPFGVNPISGPSAPPVSTVRLSLALRATKIGQLIERIAEKMRGETEQKGEWEGVKMFRERQVPPNDPKKETIYANFRRNLEDMLLAGQSSGATAIVCSVASNMRDFAPLASSGTTNALFLSAVELQLDLRVEEAARAFELALPSMRDHADLHFRLGQATLDAGTNVSIVRGYFEKARNLDALPLRTDGRMNDIIREVANKQSVKFLDLDGEMGAAAAGTTAGDETFYDHVHFTFLGNYRAARLIAAEIEKNLPGTVTAQRAVNWAPAQVCDRALALTDWNRRAAYENMMRRQMDPPFTDQSNHTNRTENLARIISEIRDALNPRSATNAAVVYQEALAKNADDFRLRESFAEFLEATGKTQEAADQRKVIAAWVPHDSVAAYQAGRLLVNARQPAEARLFLDRALKIRPVFPEAHLEVGRAFAAEGLHESAIKAYDEVLKQRKDDPVAYMQMAHSYAAMGRRKDAKAMLREAIRVRPNFWEPRYLLAIELAADNELPEAIAQFNEVTRLRPAYAQAYFNLSVALAKSGRLREAYMGFQKTLELDPEHKSAREYLGALEREYGK